MAILLSVAGGQCTNCVENESSKTKVGITAGVVFIVAGILCLVPVCWTTNTIVQDFYNPMLTSAQKRELGAALYIGWGAAALMLIGGGILCCNCPPKDESTYKTARWGVEPLFPVSHLGKCTNCLEDEVAKAKACIVSGVIFIIAALLILIPVSWSAHAVISDFYNPLVIEAQKRELGPALYIGWSSAGLLLLGGGLLCNSCPPKDVTIPYIPAKFVPARTTSSHVGYVQSGETTVYHVDIKAAGGKCTNCVEDEGAKSKVAIAAGVFFIVGGILCLIPVSWSANMVISDFYNPLLGDPQRRELGASLFIGWGSAGLLETTQQTITTAAFTADVVAIGLTVVGARCTNFFSGDWLTKANIGLAGGLVFILAGLLCVIPVSWSAYSIITGFYNPLSTSGRRGELGASIYVGWASGALLIIGLLLLIPICLTTNAIICDFYNPIMTTAQRRELGGLALHWLGSSGAAVPGGGLLCSSFLPKEGKDYDVKVGVVHPHLTSGAGLILAFIGGKCTRFLDDKGGGVKGKIAVAAGAVFIFTGLLCFIPTVWAAGSVVSEFYSLSTDAQRREIGACLYVGLGASILLILGGGLFISSACPLESHKADKSPSVRYMVVRSSNGSTQAGSQRSRLAPAMSQPPRAVFSRSQSYDGALTKLPLYTRPPRGDRHEQGFRMESERSWAPSTKSQMKSLESTKSENSEAPSQLKSAEMEDVYQSKVKMAEDVSSDPAP
ncbi:hypothetical protein FQN60_000661, partial [Etheostoma spectabile]